MTKLVYPKSGIYIMVKNNIENCNNYLIKANSNCSFVVPSNFSYISYLRSLSSTINEFKKDLSEIDYILRDISNNYQNLEDSLLEYDSKFEVVKIKERDRMIY